MPGTVEPQSDNSRGHPEARATGRLSEIAPRIAAWGPWVVASGLVVGLYRETLHWWWKAWTDGNYYCSHGPLVPFVVGYLVWSKVHGGDAQAGTHGRSDQRTAAGWMIVGGALLLQLLSLRMGIWLASGVSFVLLCFGVVWALWGRQWAKDLAVPIGFLIFMVPVPYVAAVVTGPLQSRSASFAAMGAGMLGIPVTREGLTLHVRNYDFQVAPPCSGVNSLFSLVPLAALVAYLQSSVWWRGVLLVFLSVPIALLANGMRLVLTLVLANAFGPRVADGYLHTASGLVLFGLALGGLLMAAKLVGKPVRVDLPEAGCG